MIIYIGGETAEEQTTNCRLVIKYELSNSDWTQIPNNPLTLEYSAEWAVYRQELRDFMATWTPSNEADLPDPPLP
jgi:homogentisate 1,2-dioxygenase